MMPEPARIVECLGYVGFGVADVAAWRHFATDVLGLMKDTAAADAHRYRMDDQAWRIAIDEGPDDIVYAGYQVANATMLDMARARLKQAGILVVEGDAALLRERGVGGLIACDDPDGLRIELYWGPTERSEIPFASPVGISGFVTGEQGLGHVVLGTGDIARAREFYCGILGFALSDIISVPAGGGQHIDLEFYHCNARHHTLALVPARSSKRLHHFMLQSNTLDEVGFALDRAEKAGTPISLTLGRHSNDRMVSFYARTPSGFDVEFGWGAEEMDARTWRVARHQRMSSWGHRRPAVSKQ